ncbi:MAG TPA: hypothetical protein VJT82_11265, partial [Pyrinomonadaceae bacterium]|nr:hypothetical protein [Pyrinomonadaceae bacterium]
MKTVKLLLVAGLLAQFVLFPLVGLAQTPTYTSTRELLVEFNMRAGNKVSDEVLKQMFEEADARLPDLIHALDDPDLAVNVGSQAMLKYLALPQGLAALEAWYKSQKEQGRSYRTPVEKLLSGVIYLKGDSSNLEKLTLKNALLLDAGRFGTKELFARLMARNKKHDMALIEVIQGRALKTCWHIVIRREEGKWR